MAKQSAIGANLYSGAYDLSGDVGVISSISSPRTALDITALNAAAAERILARRDGAISYAGFWNSSLTGDVAALQAAMATTADTLTLVTIPATGTFAVGDVGCGLVAKHTTFEQAFGADGSLGLTTQAQANGAGLEWGRLLTAGKVTIGTGTVNGTAVNDGAATSFGGAAYLHVFSIASGTMGATIQDSADGSTGWADISGGMAFTNVTAATSQRIVTATITTNVRQYLRLQTTGTHGNAVMAVLFVRYLTSQAT